MRATARSNSPIAARARADEPKPHTTIWGSSMPRAVSSSQSRMPTTSSARPCIWRILVWTPRAQTRVNTSPAASSCGETSATIASARSSLTSIQERVEGALDQHVGRLGETAGFRIGDPFPKDLEGYGWAFESPKIHTEVVVVHGHQTPIARYLRQLDRLSVVPKSAGIPEAGAGRRPSAQRTGVTRCADLFRKGEGTLSALDAALELALEGLEAGHQGERVDELWGRSKRFQQVEGLRSDLPPARIPSPSTGS